MNAPTTVEPPAPKSARRTGRELILATKPFQDEDVARSWSELFATLAVYSACIAGVALAPWLVLQVALAVLAGLVQFRLFSLYHDHNHGSVLAKSPAGRRIMSAIGVFLLTPRSVWKETHNFHHWNNGKLEWASIGSYPVMTSEQLEDADADTRKAYRRTRHWLGILGGYITVGIGGMCLAAFRRAPKRHWVGPVAIVLHVAALVVVSLLASPLLAALCVFAPTFVNHAFSSYLFYAQHNFPETRFFSRDEWDYTEAALHGSSYLVMGPVMRWLTANIGFHHIHHLNSKIPFYRLPEAMAAIEELQDPHRTSFAPRDVLACLELDHWNPQAQAMRTAPDLQQQACETNSAQIVVT
ncbi:MAG: fatty acid desaturase [Myxococcota bacterium]